jgi:TRAP-type mannitol/chloroaromatic compound transport system permease large subunit
VLLILYGATAGVSVVQLYAGAFFPGIMLATLYVLWIIINAKLRPGIAPPLSAEDRRVDLPRFAEIISRSSRNAITGLIGALKGKRNADVPLRTLLNHLVITLLPAIAAALLMGSIYLAVTAPDYVVPEELLEMGFGATEEKTGGLEEPEEETEGLQEPPVEDEQEAPAAAGVAPEIPKAAVADQPTTEEAAPGERKPVPMAYWITLGIVAAGLAVFYAIFTFVRLEIFKMLLSSFFPLALLILGVLGSIVVGLATPTEAAAMGSFGGFVLAAAYRQLTFVRVKESVFLCAKTSAMVCWLFVGSSIFAAAFALLGGQGIINDWVKSLDMTPVQFMLLAQVIIFLLGWPLEWTEIIVIFMPIFIPLLTYFNIDPLFFGLLVALNLQTAFLSPPVAMAAFYLKGVAPPHVSLNQIFIGMMPYMAIQVIALILLYTFPQIGLWLPSLVYKG